MPTPAVQSDNLVLQTARAGVGRAGAMRAGCAPARDRLEANGHVIWDRPLPQDGEPDDTANSWTTVRG